MSVQLQIEVKPDYLAAMFSGEAPAEEAWRRFEPIAKHCERENKNKLLLDFREAHSKVSLIDRYFLAVGAQIFAHYEVIQVAVVLRPEHIDSQGFDELVLQNRWVSLRHFTNIEDAEQWLLK